MTQDKGSDSDNKQQRLIVPHVQIGKTVNCNNNCMAVMTAISDEMSSKHVTRRGRNKKINEFGPVFS